MKNVHHLIGMMFCSMTLVGCAMSTPIQTPTSTGSIETGSTENIHTGKTSAYTKTSQSDSIKLYSDKKTGISFSYPASLNLSEIHTEAGAPVLQDGTRGTPELTHKLSLTGTNDGTSIWVTLPDNTDSTGGAPGFVYSESTLNIAGKDIIKQSRWASQEGTGSTDRGNWEISYTVGPHMPSFSIVSVEMTYQDGKNNRGIDDSTAKIVENIISQILSE